MIGADRLARLTMDDLVVGARMFYRGDQVPYVQAENLLKQFKNKSVHLLPVYVPAPATPAGVKWDYVPGSTTDIYTITKIETARTNRKGQPLLDLYHIKSDGFRDATIALNPLDVIAKFGPLTAPVDVGTMSDAINNAGQDVAAANEWLQKVKEAAW